MVFNNRSISYVFSLVVVLFSYQARAATVTYDGGGQISGLSGLFTLGASWDVTFVGGSVNSIYASAGLAYPFNEADATAARINVLGALEALVPDANTNDFLGCVNETTCNIMTPYERASDGTVQATGVNWHWINPPALVTAGNLNLDTDYDHYTYMVWEATAVPVPAAVWLFGTGLLGLIGVARRKNRV